MAEFPDDGCEENNDLQPTSVPEKSGPSRRSVLQKVVAAAAFAAPGIRTFLTGSAGAATADALPPSCGAGDIFSGLQNPTFTGPPGLVPPFWTAGGSPAPGFATYAPGSAQYPVPHPANAAYSPTVFAGSGVLRQLSSITWAGGLSYKLNLAIGQPLTEPNGETPVYGWPSTVRVYLTMGPGFAQVAAFDIPAPAQAGVFFEVPLTYTLPLNSPAVGQILGVMFFVSAQAYQAANFTILPCSVG